VSTLPLVLVSVEIAVDKDVSAEPLMLVSVERLLVNTLKDNEVLAVVDEVAVTVDAVITTVDFSLSCCI
jgi:hypothetical protein